MATNPASLFDLPGDRLLDNLKRALSLLHERGEAAAEAISDLQAGQVAAVDDLVQQITTNFSELFTDGSVVVQALQEGHYTSADIDGPVIFDVQNGLSLSLDVSGPIGFSPAPIVMIGHNASAADFAAARVVSWNKETSTLVVNILTVNGSEGPHNDCYVEVGLLSALAEVSMLEQVQALLGLTQDARDAAAAHVATAAGHVSSAASAQSAAETARFSAQGFASAAAGYRDTALGYRDQAATSAALAASSAGQIVNVLDRVDVLPTLNLDLTDINGAPFKGNLTRATGGGYRQNSKGVLVPTAANAPVIDYDVDGKPKGAGFFSAYTNLLLYSEQFDNAAWFKANLTVSADATIAPDGNLTMDALVEDAATSQHSISRVATKSASALPYTLSLFVKAGKGRQIVLNLFGAGYAGGVQMRFNPEAGAITTAAFAYGTGFASGSGSFAKVSDGVYLVWVTATSDTTTSIGGQFGLHNGTALSYTGDGTSGVNAWGAQLTQTAFPGPYVPTTSAAVVRNADSMVISGTDFTDFFNPIEGTIFAEFRAPAYGASQLAWTLSDGTYPNALFGALNTDGRIYTLGGGGWNLSLPPGPTIDAATAKMATTYATSAVRMSVNGAVAVADTSVTVPALSRLSIGGDWLGTGNHLRGFIRRIIYWPKALSATDLQRITA
ncbi:hypothetical protein GB927_012890 [Shinella sp. CPCC 100929]|uniref:Concanavalin A-like lectin/glucanase superfamily protein n=1 Tax=Shinella lacus TaxID=2654216 RepID=A0ABT1R6X7_9HYPH|nr:hypothetical protein [Shinella lacus]MCQ4630942.1 hypothetical protein [Shinella lacus]